MLDCLLRLTGAQLRGHFGVVVDLGARRDEEQGETTRTIAKINPQFNPVGVDEREGSIIGQQIDVEVILPDRRELQAAFAPR